MSEEESEQPNAKEEFFPEGEEQEFFQEQDEYDVAQPVEVNLLLGALAGLSAALITGVGWAVMVAITGMEIGYAALGVGAVVGFAAMYGAGGGNAAIAMIAVACSILGMGIGKVGTAVIVQPGQLMEEIAYNDEYLGEVVFQIQAEAGQISPEIVALNEKEMPLSANETRILGEEKSRIAGELQQMSDEDREAIAEPLVDRILADISWLDRLSLSFFDLLWIALAIGAAWKVGSGEAFEE